MWLMFVFWTNWNVGGEAIAHVFVFRSSVQSIFFQLSAELYFPSFFSQLGLKRNECRIGDGSLCAINSIRIHALCIHYNYVLEAEVVLNVNYVLR